MGASHNESQVRDIFERSLSDSGEFIDNPSICVGEVNTGHRLLLFFMIAEVGPDPLTFDFFIGGWDIEFDTGVSGFVVVTGKFKNEVTIFCGADE